MTFDLISGLHMQIQTWHPPLWLCTQAKYYVKSGLTNVLKNFGILNRGQSDYVLRIGQRGSNFDSVFHLLFFLFIRSC